MSINRQLNEAAIAGADRQLNAAILTLQTLNFGEKANDDLSSSIREYRMAVTLGLETALLAQKAINLQFGEDEV